MRRRRSIRRSRRPCSGSRTSSARGRATRASTRSPLHALVPDPSLYPVDEFRRALNRVLADEGAELLRYGGPQGHAGLREVLADRLRETGAQVTADTIALTQGATEGITLALRLFAEPGDAVAVEEPTYHNVLGTLIALRLQPVPIPMRDGAPDLGVLERALDRPDVKLFYTMPTFHNPLGTSTPVEHRRELLALAARAGEADRRGRLRDGPPLRGEARPAARRARPRRPRRAALLVLEVALPGRARRRRSTRAAGSSTRCSR